MAKRKTRHQKILADQRHSQYHFENPQPADIQTSSAEVKLKLPAFDLPKSSVQTAGSYNHVMSDIRKTALITGVLFSAEILIFVFSRV
jgi:hypothetical protein